MPEPGAGRGHGQHQVRAQGPRQGTCPRASSRNQKSTRRQLCVCELTAYTREQARQDRFEGEVKGMVAENLKQEVDPKPQTPKPQP